MNNAKEATQKNRWRHYFTRTEPLETKTYEPLWGTSCLEDEHGVKLVQSISHWIDGQMDGQMVGQISQSVRRQTRQVSKAHTLPIDTHSQP